MFTAKMSAIGQISIPIDVRRDLNLTGGAKIQFIKIADGRYEIVPATEPVTKLKGLIKPSKKVTIEEMNLVIAKCGGSL